MRSRRKVISPALQRGEGIAVVELESRRDGLLWRTRTRTISFIVFQHQRSPFPHSCRPQSGTLCLHGRHCPRRGFLVDLRRRNGEPRSFVICLPASHSLAHAVQKLKGSSSRWMGDGFSWQDGYGAFSVSPSQVEIVRGYIQNQEEHHRKRDFEQEFVAILHSCGIAYDERYVFG